MRQLDHLLYQVDFVIWSDNAAVAAAATVPAEGYFRELGFSFGSVHKTLMHMLGGQETWIERWQGVSDPALPTDADVPTLDVLRSRWDGVHQRLRAYVAIQTERSLAEEIEVERRGVRIRTPRWTLILHCLDHSTFHKGQLNSLVKLAGGTPADIGMATKLGQEVGTPL